MISTIFMTSIIPFTFLHMDLINCYIFIYTSCNITKSKTHFFFIAEYYLSDEKSNHSIKNANIYNCHIFRSSLEKSIVFLKKLNFRFLELVYKIFKNKPCLNLICGKTVQVEHDGPLVDRPLPMLRTRVRN